MMVRTECLDNGRNAYQPLSCLMLQQRPIECCCWVVAAISDNYGWVLLAVAGGAKQMQWPLGPLQAGDQALGVLHF